MCFTTQVDADQKALEKRFEREYTSRKPTGKLFHAFDFPKTPVISNQSPDSIELYNWGLIPTWSNDLDIRKFTLNAKIETLTEKPSFKNYLDNRCLIIVDGFYEWQWLDPKGKQKLKYLITNKAREIYTMAGIWSEWENPENGELVKSYSMITQPANELMSEIHNTKQRMPLILNPDTKEDWLNGMDIDKCVHPVELAAQPIYDKPIQTSMLF